jgi:hypothetical protein
MGWVDVETIGGSGWDAAVTRQTIGKTCRVVGGC